MFQLNNMLCKCCVPCLKMKAKQVLLKNILKMTFLVKITMKLCTMYSVQRNKSYSAEQQVLKTSNASLCF